MCVCVCVFVCVCGVCVHFYLDAKPSKYLYSLIYH